MATEIPPFPHMPQRATPSTATSNEVDLLQVMFPRLGPAPVTTTEIVPSTSHSHQQIVNRETQVKIYSSSIIYLIIQVKIIT